MSARPTWEPGSIPAPADLLDRMVRAVEKVRERLQRTTAALEGARIPYAVVGEQAVSLWVSRVDEAAVRYSPEIEILLNRSDLPVAREAMAKAGFVFGRVDGIDLFLEKPHSKVRDCVRIVYARERIRDDDVFPAPGIEESEEEGDFQIIARDPLVTMKLQSYRLDDQVNIRDMIDVGLVDESWVSRLPAPLAERLKELLDSPGG